MVKARQRGQEKLFNKEIPRAIYSPCSLDRVGLEGVSLFVKREMGREAKTDSFSVQKRGNEGEFGVGEMLMGGHGQEWLVGREQNFSLLNLDLLKCLLYILNIL